MLASVIGWPGGCLGVAAIAADHPAPSRRDRRRRREAGALGLGKDRFLMSADHAHVAAMFAATLMRNDHGKAHDVGAVPLTGGSTTTTLSHRRLREGPQPVMRISSTERQLAWRGETLKLDQRLRRTRGALRLMKHTVFLMSHQDLRTPRSLCGTHGRPRAYTSDRPPIFRGQKIVL
jgi:hypothetical protein